MARCALLVSLIVLIVPAAAVAAWTPVDYFWTPAKTTYCEMQKGAGTRLSCSVDGKRDAFGNTTLYLLKTRGKVTRARTQGQGGVEFPSLSYDRWYSMYGGTVKVGKAAGAINCIVRRSSGLHCKNRSGHGFVLSSKRQRTF